MAKVKKNGRITNEARIAAAWRMSGQVWPPELGDKVKLFTPKGFRGKVAKVIAIGEDMAKNSTRKAPEGKARVAVRIDGEIEQFAISRDQAFPNEYKLKDLDTVL